jgi:hypothetical protein
MHHSSGLRSSGSKVPALLGLALLSGAVALFTGACGGSASDGGLSDASPGAGGGSQSAGAGGSTAGAGGATAGTAGAAGDAGPVVCVPGAQVSCPCPGTTVKGVQTCTPSGTGLSACTGCPGGQAGSGAGGSGAGGNSAGGKAQGGAGGTTAGGSGTPDLFNLMPPDAQAACYECVIADCKSEVEACNNDPDCATGTACLIDSCLDKTSNNALISCAFGCGFSPQGASTQLALPIVNCAGKQCQGSCAFAGGGGGMGQGGMGQAGTGQGGSTGDPGAAPDKVACGSNLCDTTKGEDCCISVQGFTPDFSCKAAGQCKGGIVSIEQPCDGPEDCGGKSCCATLNGLQSTITCADSCGGGQQSTQLCHKDNDCAAPATCQSCSVMGFAFRLCGTACPGG